MLRFTAFLISKCSPEPGAEWGGEQKKRFRKQQSLLSKKKKKKKKEFGPVVLANLLLRFNSDEQNDFNCRMQPLFLLVWQRNSPLQEGRAPRYRGNTEPG